MTRRYFEKGKLCCEKREVWKVENVWQFDDENSHIRFIFEVSTLCKRGNSSMLNQGEGESAQYLKHDFVL